MVRFGNYELISRIGAGGMAEVFKARLAREGGFERLVAIKRILPGNSEDPEFIEQFRTEARISAQLMHQNIVQVYDFGCVDGAWYIAMEYIPGPSLHELMKKFAAQSRVLPLPVSLSILSEIASGLGYAHRALTPEGEPLRLVHRDVSSKNVLISFEGAVKLMDFGIAKATGRSYNTKSGIIKGKIAYLSPEQIRGQPLDGRSDLFSLGILAYEMFTGIQPFGGDSDYQILFKILSEAPESIRGRNTKVPDALDGVVMKLLAKNPEERYQQAEHFRRELAEIQRATADSPGAGDIPHFMAYLRKNKIIEAPEDRPVESLSIPVATVTGDQVKEASTGAPVAQPTGSTAVPPPAATPLSSETALGSLASLTGVSAHEAAIAGPPRGARAIPAWLLVLMGALIVVLGAAVYDLRRVDSAILGLLRGSAGDGQLGLVPATPRAADGEAGEPTAPPGVPTFDVVAVPSLPGAATARPGATPAPDSGGAPVILQRELTLTTNPTGAAITVDGGTVPQRAPATITIRGAAGSDHLITASTPCHVATQRRITLDSAAPEALELRLEPEVRAVRVTSVPAHAAVSLAGRALGRTPLTAMLPPAGCGGGKLKLELDGYKAAVRDLPASAELAVELAASTDAAIQVTSPVDMELSVDDKGYGKVGGGGRMVRLEAGVHKVVLVSVRPYYLFRKTIEVRAGTPVPVTVPEPQYGYLNVSCSAACDVFVDDVPLGESPLLKWPVAAGPEIHRVRLQYRIPGVEPLVYPTTFKPGVYLSFPRKSDEPGG
ncbi:MAG: protein kinase [Candidatus Schekmanbacteria bacterium]|nr:protein kinase [Candidatus Schekmanbacteria bacterium]